MPRNSGFPYNSELFDEKVFQRYIREEKSRTSISNQNERIGAIQSWLKSIPGDAGSVNERSLEQKFCSTLFENVLGYTTFPASQASLWIKPPKNKTNCQGTPDFVLGRFHKNGDKEFRVAGELKPPGVDLDAPQPRKDRKSPVEQAFEYGEEILGVEWVVVSDMREFRLYSVESQQNYAHVDLSTCVVGGQAKKIWYKLFYLFSEPYLIGDGDPSPVARIFSKSLSHKGEISEDFYDVYYQIRVDLFEAFQCEVGNEYTRKEILQAVQRLLDRLVFIYYCEDAPKPLIEQDALKKVVESASQLPGSGDDKIYEYLKDFFREVDAGSHADSGLNIPGYNGELFKEHEIVDSISLPDKLHTSSEYEYKVELPNGKVRRVNGVWGLHAFDFWSELNEHLLGHIFEKSLSDIVEMEKDGEAELAERMDERKTYGIYYTTQVLTEYISSQVVKKFLGEVSAEPADGNPKEEKAREALETEIERLKDLKILDPACGSGAFLVSSFRELHLNIRRLEQSLSALQDNRPAPLLDRAKHFSNAEILKTGFFGADLLPQAVEIAKLALWLNTARRDETVADLTGNFYAGDSLRVSRLEKGLSEQFPGFDLVIGNPPWGGEMEEKAVSEARSVLNISDDIADLDSWEMFVRLSVHAIKEGGRIALVLPDTFFSPAKKETRHFILNELRIEKLISLGPDWFGPDVRMGAVYLQAKKSDYESGETFTGLLLTGDMRESAIEGDLPLAQIENNFSRQIPLDRCNNSENSEIEIFRGQEDDRVMEKMLQNGVLMRDFCNWYRGEELSKAGLLWRCPSCQMLTTPGSDKKGGGYYPTDCPRCGAEFTDEESEDVHIVSDNPDPDVDSVPFVDGDDINHRYKKICAEKYFMRGHDGWEAKEESFYESPKVFIRESGIGLDSMLDLNLDAWCPRSVYTWQIKEKWTEQGYDHRYLYACLQSRMLAYFVFKKFAEVDPDRAHANLRITQIKELPIPEVDFSEKAQKERHDRICELVDEMLGGEKLGTTPDLEIDNLIREQWGLDSSDAKHVHSELKALPKSQLLQDLYPSNFADSQDD